MLSEPLLKNNMNFLPKFVKIPLGGILIEIAPKLMIHCTFLRKEPMGKTLMSHGSLTDSLR